MRVLGLGQTARVYLEDEIEIVEPEARKVEVDEALDRIFRVWRSSPLEGGGITENEIELKPGDPGHAAEALRSLTWIDSVTDFEDATLTAEGEE